MQCSLTPLWLCKNAFPFCSFYDAKKTLAYLCSKSPVMLSIAPDRMTSYKKVRVSMNLFLSFFLFPINFSLFKDALTCRLSIARWTHIPLHHLWDNESSGERERNWFSLLFLFFVPKKVVHNPSHSCMRPPPKSTFFPSLRQWTFLFLFFEWVQAWRIVISALGWQCPNSTPVRFQESSNCFLDYEPWRKEWEKERAINEREKERENDQLISATKETMRKSWKKRKREDWFWSRIECHGVVDLKLWVKTYTITAFCWRRTRTFT